MPEAHAKLCMVPKVNSLALFVVAQAKPPSLWKTGLNIGRGSRVHWPCTPWWSRHHWEVWGLTLCCSLRDLGQIMHLLKEAGSISVTVGKVRCLEIPWLPTSSLPGRWRALAALQNTWSIIPVLAASSSAWGNGLEYGARSSAISISAFCCLSSSGSCTFRDFGSGCIITHASPSEGRYR